MLERGRQADCLGAFEGHLDVVEVLAGCDQGVGFDGAVALNQSLPERSQRRAAAMSAARLGVDHGVAKAIVHVVDEEPSPPIRHSELAAGLGDRQRVRSMTRCGSHDPRSIWEAAGMPSDGVTPNWATAHSPPASCIVSTIRLREEAEPIRRRPPTALSL